ncbi:MAG: hypothetical protein ABT03_01475 [Comamonas sp. SCN 67-35]|uniref:hypothetical protein n=1 Tax=unclassified Comamonas TaxID=2638500 RepID=UPI00086DB8BA|nr:MULTISPECIES: hypothetical protein [unclassified Comamonas]MBN9330712.1 hypothetical protein [Comamonas sp.]ODU39953.1 MAG: hypothetical protein ABT03_01475 [Comamonas sp. SCN 67-35]OJW98015.1 MAG: hypothetical protein BGO73_11635 [Burkholderiales bacterium 66-26]
MLSSRFSLLASATLPLAVLLYGVPAHAATANAAASCASVPAESRAACVREVGAAAQAARAGQLTSDDAATYERNALARCSVFKNPQDKSDCIKRMGPRASLSGSVEGGGILRQETDTYIVK